MGGYHTAHIRVWYPPIGAASRPPAATSHEAGTHFPPVQKMIVLSRFCISVRYILKPQGVAVRSGRAPSGNGYLHLGLYWYLHLGIYSIY